MRFNNSFEYIAPQNADQFEDFLIPIMQLQIHVENAIEHGLRNRVDSKSVSIEIIGESDHIKFIIEDDGIGRIGAEKINSQGTQSGTIMLQKVHDIINNANNSQLPQVYEDEIFGDHGTRVIIKIPKNINYEI